jgi:hypothetical protein
MSRFVLLLYAALVPPVIGLTFFVIFERVVRSRSGARFVTSGHEAWLMRVFVLILLAFLVLGGWKVPSTARFLFLFVAGLSSIATFLFTLGILVAP